MKKIFVMVLVFTGLTKAQSVVGEIVFNEKLENYVGIGLYSNQKNDGLGYTILLLTRGDSRVTNYPAKISGILSHDLFGPDSITFERDSVVMRETRSALKSGFFSFVIPGAGQACNGDFTKAAGFLAVEVAGWIVNTIWNKKGNDETNFFRTYADGTAANHYQDGHYNVYRYAQWIVNNYQQLEQSDGTSAADQAIISQQIGHVLVTKTYDLTKAPWTQVDWIALNNVENALGGGYFNHWLFPYGDVEYYKEIAKYVQFVPGWEDANASNGWQFGNFTQLSTYYEGMRSKATGYYNFALAGLCVLIANHFVSAAEAAIWTHGHNKLIEISIGVNRLPLQVTGYQTQFNLALAF